MPRASSGGGKKKVRRKPALSGFVNAREAGMYGGSEKRQRQVAQQISSNLAVGRAERAKVRRSNALEAWRNSNGQLGELSPSQEAIVIRDAARNEMGADWKNLPGVDKGGKIVRMPQVEAQVKQRRDYVQFQRLPQEIKNMVTAEAEARAYKQAFQQGKAQGGSSQQLNELQRKMQATANEAQARKLQAAEKGLVGLKPDGKVEWIGQNPDVNPLSLENVIGELIPDQPWEIALTVGTVGIGSAVRGAWRAGKFAKIAADAKKLKAAGDTAKVATKSRIAGAVSKVTAPITESAAGQATKQGAAKVADATTSFAAGAPKPVRVAGSGVGKTVKAAGQHVGRRKYAYLLGPGATGVYGAAKSGDLKDIVTDPAQMGAAVVSGAVSDPGKTAESTMAGLLAIPGVMGEMLLNPLLSVRRAAGTAVGAEDYTGKQIAAPTTQMVDKQVSGLKEYLDTFTSGDAEKMRQAVINEYGVIPAASVLPMGIKPFVGAGKAATKGARVAAARGRTKFKNVPYDPERPIFLVGERRGDRISVAMNFGQAILGKRIEKGQAKKGIDKQAARARRSLPIDEYPSEYIPNDAELKSGVRRKPIVAEVGADAALYEIVSLGLPRDAIALRRWISDQLPAQNKLAEGRVEPLRGDAIPREWSLRYLNKHLDEIVANDNFWNAAQRITDQIAQSVAEGGRGYSPLANARAVGETRTDGQGRFDPIPQPEERVGLRTRLATGERLRADAEAKILAKEKQLKAVQGKIRDASRRGNSAELKALEKKANQIQRRRDNLVGELRQIEKTVARQDPAGFPLTQAELEGITDWTTATEHGAVQRVLYGETRSSEANPGFRKRTQSIIRRLDAAFRKQRPLARDIVVYHRFPLERDLNSRLIPEGLGGRNPGYLATSFRDIPRFREAGQLVEIRVPKGSRVINVPANLKRNPSNESEVLLPRDTYFEWIDETPDGTLIYEARTPDLPTARADDVALNRRRAEELSTLEADLTATRQEARTLREQERAAARDDVAALRDEAKRLGTQVREGRAGLREPVSDAVKREYIAEVQAYADSVGVRTDRWLGQLPATVKSDMNVIGGMDNLTNVSRIGRQKGEKARTGALARQGNIDNSYDALMKASVDIPVERKWTFKAIADSLFPYRYRPVEGVDRYTSQEIARLVTEGRVDWNRFTAVPYQVEKRIEDFMQRTEDATSAELAAFADDINSLLEEHKRLSPSEARILNPMQKDSKRRPPEEAWAVAEESLNTTLDNQLRERLAKSQTPEDEISQVIREDRAGREYSLYPIERVREVQKQLAPMTGLTGAGMTIATVFNKAASLLLLGTSPVWLSLQFLAETLQGASAISATGLPTPVAISKVWFGKAAREARKLSHDERVGFMAAAGEAPGIDQPLTGIRSGFAEGFIQNADNSLGIFKAYGLLEGAKRLMTLKTLGDIDRWKTSVIRRGVAAEYVNKRLNSFGANIKATFDLQDAIYKELKDKSLEEQLRYFATNPKANVQLANYMRDLMGDWYYLTSLERAPAAIAMFYPYIRMSLRYTFWGLPKNHPVKWAIMTTFGAAQAEQLRDLLHGSPGFIAKYAQPAIMGGTPTEDNPYGVTSTLDFSRVVPGANAIIENVLGNSPEKTPLAILNPVFQAANTLATGTQAFGNDVSGGFNEQAKAALLSLLSLPMPIRALDQLNITSNPLGKALNEGEGPNTEAYRRGIERDLISLLAPAYKPKSLKAARTDIAYQVLFDLSGKIYEMQDKAYSEIKPLENAMLEAKAQGNAAEFKRLQQQAIAMRKEAYATYRKGRLAQAELDRLAKAYGPDWFKISSSRRNKAISANTQDLWFAYTGSKPLTIEQFDKMLARVIKRKEYGVPAYRRKAKRIQNAWLPIEDWPQGFAPIPEGRWQPNQKPLWKVNEDRGRWTPINN